MKKKVSIIVCCALALVLILIFCLKGCTYRLARPENTNLEFWITEEVDSWYLEGYQPRYGLMGGREYYGSKYLPTYDENEQQVDPAHCVIYTITSYPDHSSRSSAITEIFISDPEVYIYGLTFRSNQGDIIKGMTEAGYKNPEHMTFTKGKVTVKFGKDSIRIKAEVTNKFGIVF